jgi:hypothetical protein
VEQKHRQRKEAMMTKLLVGAGAEALCSALFVISLMIAIFDNENQEKDG